ncbi:MAG: leucine-rich repeat domain-containing protein [Clostridia bacterium]|nr:leucine-rich repeat domain-containing protein [Clostridia bacterium]
MKRIGIGLVFCLCLLLFAAGCSGAEFPVEEPAASEAPAPLPTPVAVNGAVAENGVLRAAVDADDFALIERIPGLHTLDVSGSVCYDAILAYRDAHPEVDVIYTVSVGETALSPDVQAASVKSVPDAGVLRYLPALSELTVTEPMTAEDAAALTAALPDAALSYAVSAAGVTLSSDAAAADLSDVSPAFLDEVCDAVAVLPNLVDIELNRADGTSDWTLEDAGRLQAIRPEIRVDLNVTAFGRRFSLTDDVVNFNGVLLSDRTEELTALLPYLRCVGRLDMENCGIPDEEMAALREAFPSPKIVWRVHVGAYSCRTDVKMIRFTMFYQYPMLRDINTRGLIYCNEVRYLDLGHNLIQDAYFVGYMPDLEVCILAIQQPTDISAFANCPHLEYAELFNGHITDISALANCTELRHLNLCMNKITDISPLYGLTKLERLWIARNRIPDEQIEEFKKRVPDCVVNTTAKDPTLNEWRFDYSRKSTYSVRYELLRKQFRYGESLTSSVDLPNLG